MTIDTLRVLIYPSDDIYIGQCLEHDLCVRGDNVQDVRRRINQTVLAYAEDGLSFFDLPKAPKQFFDLWDSGDQPPFRIESDPISVNIEMRAVAA